jgi:hypothetical protein
MNKIQLTVEYLYRALVLLPDDNSLGAAKSHIKKAVNEIKNVESKRTARVEVSKINKEQRESAAQKWGHAIGVGLAKPLSEKQAKDALNKIEQMIGQEKKDTETEPAIIVN